MNNIMLILIAAAAGFSLTALLGFLFIPWLHKLKFGQTILDVGPTWHKHKQGTPTMGGLMFITGTAAAVIAGVVTAKIMGIDIVAGDSPVPADMKTKFWSGLLMALSLALVGFTDDYIKVIQKRNLGLNMKQKTMLQLLIILAYLSSLRMGMGNEPHMFIPFAGNVIMGLFYWIFGICVIFGAVNAVNITDGIDGLCSSVTATAAVTLGIIAAMRGFFGVSLAAAALAGGCAGFLIWNRHPAKVMMGDTGSFFLGGMVVALAYALGCPVILLPVGLIYVIEAMSDIIQIGYFKATKGKRIFKMAPIHHHLEMSGWSEKKIVAVFTLLSISGGAAGIALMFYGK
jgi:phospho-N-acetylmuramoyl-pentapeptide-transferase